MDLLKWSKRPAVGVDARTPEATIIRGLVARATTPLLPDDYLHLLNPLWSARELRGRVLAVRRETEDTATVRIQTGWGFPESYKPGQYVGIGLQVGGRWHWRSYSLTSIGESSAKTIAITVKANPDGFLSTHLVDGVTPGTIIRLAAPRGDFHLPDPVPPKILFLTAGSGITPVMSMLRSLARRPARTGHDVVHVHSAPTRDEVIFRAELEALPATLPGYALRLQYTREEGKFDLGRLDEQVPDWRERPCWACGPVAMLDEIEEHYVAAGVRDLLHIERFAIARTDHGGSGGRVTFARSGRSADIDGATTLLEAGEELGVPMPFGCRMGICQTCVVELAAGYARDLRTGVERREGERIQTCVSSVSGACTLDL
ncbi:MAG: ferredoxin reductase [Gordonia sp. (in: high G+C Gram-positive bacteria)]